MRGGVVVPLIRQAEPRARTLNAWCVTARNLGPGGRRFSRGGTVLVNHQPTARRPSLDTVTCACGRDATHTLGRCARCYLRDWRKGKAVAGGPIKSPHVQEWFDWEYVERRWRMVAEGMAEDTDRRPTRAERDYLASLALDWSDVALGRLLGMEWNTARVVANDIREGRVVVPARDWQGRARCA